MIAQLLMLLGSLLCGFCLRDWLELPRHRKVKQRIVWAALAVLIGGILLAVFTSEARANSREPQCWCGARGKYLVTDRIEGPTYFDPCLPDELRFARTFRPVGEPRWCCGSHQYDRKTYPPHRWDWEHSQTVCWQAGYLYEPLVRPEPKE